MLCISVAMKYLLGVCIPGAYVWCETPFEWHTFWVQHLMCVICVSIINVHRNHLYYFKNLFISNLKIN